MEVFYTLANAWGKSWALDEILRTIQLHRVNYPAEETKAKSQFATTVSCKSCHRKTGVETFLHPAYSSNPIGGR